MENIPILSITINPDSNAQNRYKKTLINLLDDAMSSIKSSDLGMGLDYHIEEIIKEIKISYEEAYTGCVKSVKIEREISYVTNDKQLHKIYDEELVYINIPMGIDDGEIIMLNEKGNIYGKIKGDVKVIIRLEKHEIFTRDGLNLVLNKRITLQDAINGIKLQIVHLNKRKYTFTTAEKIIQPNSIEEIADLGFKRNDVDITGKLLIKFTVYIPEGLSLEDRGNICLILNDKN